MKKLFVLLLSLCLCTSLGAQNTESSINDSWLGRYLRLPERFPDVDPVGYYGLKNEINVQYGQLTMPGLTFSVASLFGRVFTLGHFSFENLDLYGAASVSYYRHINNWLSVGGIVCADYSSGEAYTIDSDGVKTNHGRYMLSCYSLMPSARIYWYKKPGMAYYSSVAVGISRYSMSDVPASITSTGFQLNFSGCEFGSADGTWRMVVEFGFGYTGIISIGLKKAF